MISSEVQRTLVKSPPELWTELSDAASLGRHLGEFGEIRITRVEPEKTVEWEAENTSGTVSIKPSGWGTRVILKATRETPAPDPASEPEPAASPEPPTSPQPDTAGHPAAEAEAEAATAETETEHEMQAEGQPHAADDFEPAAAIDGEWPAEPMIGQGTEIYPDPLADEPAGWEEPDWEYEQEPEAEPRRGFLARLFGWRRREKTTELPSPALAGETPLEWRAAADAAFEPAPEWPQAAESSLAEPHDPSQADAPASQAAEPDAPRAESSQPDSTQVAQQDSDAPSKTDISAELQAAEEVATDEVASEEVTAVLTSMLDRLGTAHHRPFSRA